MRLGKEGRFRLEVGVGRQATEVAGVKAEAVRRHPRDACLGRECSGGFQKTRVSRELKV